MFLASWASCLNAVKHNWECMSVLMHVWDSWNQTIYHHCHTLPRHKFAFVTDARHHWYRTYLNLLVIALSQAVTHCRRFVLFSFFLSAFTSTTFLKPQSKKNKQAKNLLTGYLALRYCIHIKAWITLMFKSGAAINKLVWGPWKDQCPVTLKKAPGWNSRVRVIILVNIFRTLLNLVLSIKTQFTASVGHMVHMISLTQC